MNKQGSDVVYMPSFYWVGFSIRALVYVVLCVWLISLGYTIILRNGVTDILFALVIFIGVVLITGIFLNFFRKSFKTRYIICCVWALVAIVSIGISYAIFIIFQYLPFHLPVFILFN